MDGLWYAIRPFLDTDFEAIARLAREMDPEHSGTAEEFRHWDEVQNLERDHLNLKSVAEERRTREVVGWGSLTQPTFNFDPRRFWIWTAVAPGHRQRGIGTELFSRMEQEARVRNGIGLWADTGETDPAGIRFFERKGFRILRKSWLSRLDLGNLDLSAIPDRSASLEREGFRFTTLTEEGATSLEVRRKLCRLCQLSRADIPRIGQFHPASFEEFVATEIETPRSMTEGIFLACHGANIVGTSTLERDLARPDTLWVGYTGTDPDFRGRGIATEVKRRATLFAQERGFRFLIAGNDSLNHPILAINQRFGFRPETVWVQGEKSWATSPQ